VAVGLLALVAWATSRTTVYTVTNKRIVMRIGIALPVTFNLPYAKMIRADLAVRKDGSGDIVTTLVPGERIAYLVLWPHLRPWSVSQPQPALRCIPDARRVGALLGVALSSAPVIRVRMPEVATADVGDRAQFGASGQLSAAE
jgi:hypothetical protein